MVRFNRWVMTVICGLLLVLPHTARAADTTAPAVINAPAATKYVSATFAELLGRVAAREPESGAIMRIKPKADAATGARELNFSLVKDKDGSSVLIKVDQPLMTGNRVYEQYILRIDDAIRDELAKQARLVEVMAERRRQFLEDGKKHIAQLSGEKVKAGMGEVEVAKILGKPEKRLDWQAANYFSLYYPGYVLHFQMGALTNAEALGSNGEPVQN